MAMTNSRMATYLLKIYLLFLEYWMSIYQNRKVRKIDILVIDMLGDRVLKSDNPLVSSKVDFADFLALIVYLKLLRLTRRDRSP